MGSTLTYGRKRPDDLDKGSYFFDALRDNITTDDAHDHDGANSASLSSYNMATGSVAVTNSGWSASGVIYRKSVTLAAGYTWGNCNIRFFINGGTNDEEEFFPKTEYINATSFYLYMPMNNQAVTVLCI